MTSSAKPVMATPPATARAAIAMPTARPSAPTPPRD